MATNTVDATAAPPFRFWGDISSLVELTKSTGEGGDKVRRQNRTTLNMSSYIWRSWFLTYQTSLSGTQTTDKNTTNHDVSGSFLSGDLNFSLFPSSRFPFDFFAEKRRNESSLNLVHRGVETKRYGFRQSYRNLSGKRRLDLSFERARHATARDGDERNRIYNFNISQSWGSQQLNVHTQLQRRRNPGLNAYATDRSVVARHYWRHPDGISVENLASAIEVSDRYQDQRHDLDTLQMSSFATWRPQKLHNLMVSGSVRASQLDSSNIAPGTVNTANAKRLSTNLSAAYEVNNRMNIRGGLSLADGQSNGEDFRTRTESLSFTYIPREYTFRNFRYDRLISNTVINASDGIDDNQRLTSRLRHGIDRTFTPFETTHLTATFDQGIARIVESNNPPTLELTHSMSFQWRLGKTSKAGSFRATLRDAKRRGPNDANFRIANLQYEQNRSISRDRKIHGNLTIQYTRHETERNVAVNVIANGNVTYSQRNFVDIPALSLDLELDVQSRGLTPKGYERFRVSDESPHEAMLESKLSYRIGLLVLSGSAGFLLTDGYTSNMIKLELNRALGYR